MLITAAHLLVLMLLLSGALIAGAAAENPIAFIAALGAVTLAAWPVFRLLALRPLILPLCPHCGKRHANYHVPREAWPVAVLICATCGKPLRLVLRGSAAPSDIPSVTLRWPGFLGLWRP